MQLQLDVNNVIIGMATIGSIEGAIDYNGPIPDDFEAKFKPSFYMLQNDVIMENSDYKEPSAQIPDMLPSDQEKINAQLMLNQATQKQVQDTFNSQILIQIAKLGGAQ